MGTTIRKSRGQAWLHGRLLPAMTALTLALLAFPANAADSCRDLPASKLQVYSVKAPTVDEREMPSGQLDLAGPKDALVSRHTMMLSASNVVVLFSITHRILPQADGSVCDSPSLVRIGFGVSSRLVLLPSAAANDDCLRREMLAHESAHSRAMDETVDRFIDQHPTEFQQAMLALKRVPAANEQAARKRWDTGLKALLEGAKRQLAADLQATIDRTDDPPQLTKLETACGSRIRQLEEQNRHQMSL